MDEPCSALDPIATARIEDLMEELKAEFTIVIVTHNMQQAARTSDRTAFFTAEVDDQGKPCRAARRVRRHREDLHGTRRSPHRGLHHRAVRLTMSRPSAPGRLPTPRPVVERATPPPGPGTRPRARARTSGDRPASAGREHQAHDRGNEEEERAAVHQNSLRMPYGRRGHHRGAGNGEHPRPHDAAGQRPTGPPPAAGSHPTPTMPPVMVWVVDTGMPCADVKKSIAAAADSAHTPPTGLEAGELRAHGLHDAPAAR